jgi:hypothetical protein
VQRRCGRKLEEPGEAACLTCFERDHHVCHRDVIVDSLRELRPDLTVEHPVS